MLWRPSSLRCYLDAGLEVAQRFILQHILEPELAEVHQQGGEKLPVMDYKSALQEAVHASGRPQPRYVLVKEEGPDHRKMFTMEAHVPASPGGDDGFVRRSEGSTKKAAEQGAARQAWEYLQSLKSSSGLEDPAPHAERLRAFMSEVGAPDRKSDALPRSRSPSVPAPPAAQPFRRHEFAAIAGHHHRDRGLRHQLYRAGIPDSLRVDGEDPADRRLPAGGQGPLRTFAALALADALPADPAPGHHRLPLSA